MSHCGLVWLAINSRYFRDTTLDNEPGWVHTRSSHQIGKATTRIDVSGVRWPERQARLARPLWISIDSTPDTITSMLTLRRWPVCQRHGKDGCVLGSSRFHAAFARERDNNADDDWSAVEDEQPRGDLGNRRVGHAAMAAMCQCTHRPGSCPSSSPCQSPAQRQIQIFVSAYGALHQRNRSLCQTLGRSGSSTHCCPPSWLPVMPVLWCGDGAKLMD